MSGFIQGEDRFQATLFPERLDDYVAEDSAVRVIDAFLDDLDLSGLGFKTQPNDTGRPAYHPSTMLKLFVYGYLNRVQSSRRLEIEAQRNVELMWLTGRLAPDFKTIADFRKDNGEAIRLVCREFVMLCRKFNLFANAFVAIDGSKFKAVNSRDRNFTRAKMKRRLAEVDASIDRFMVRNELRTEWSITLGTLSTLIDVEGQFIRNPVLINIADILHSFTANALGSDDFHVVKPDIGVQSHLYGFLAQLYDSAWPCIVSSKRKQGLFFLTHVRVVEIGIA